MLEWIKTAVIYEIYPISFFDSDGDGLGDFKGIELKIPYLKDLGINTVWINPFYKSPFKDGGYDITDYYAVDEKFGKMKDFDDLIKAFHQAGIRVITDLVIGHTSDKHPWFKESAKRKPNPKYKDFYVWTDSCFTPAERAIKGMSERDGNYIVNYYAFQPALNYGFGEIKSGEEVWKWHYTDERLIPLREEMLNIMRFWLSKGVDGFRVDLANSLVKSDKNGEGVKWLWNLMIREIKKDYPDCVFLSEWGDPVKAAKCGFDIDYMCHATQAYNELLRSEKGTNLTPWLERAGHSYFAREGKGNFNNFLNYVKGIFSNPSVCYTIPTGFHDIIRIAEKKDEDLLKCIFAFILTFKCVPQIYYGDEIGIKHNRKVSKDGGYLRTGARTPMQWDNSLHRGFTTAKRAYLPTEKAKRRSVESQAADKNSLYNTVKKLIALHNRFKQFSFGSGIKMLNAEYPLEYLRGDGKNKIYIAINPTGEEFSINKPSGEILLKQNAEIKEKTIKLSGCGFIVSEQC